MAAEIRVEDLEWARAFVGAKLPNVGVRFNDTVEVLAAKLSEIRAENVENKNG